MSITKVNSDIRASFGYGLLYSQISFPITLSFAPSAGNLLCIAVYLAGSIGAPSGLMAFSGTAGGSGPWYASGGAGGSSDHIGVFTGAAFCAGSPSTGVEVLFSGNPVGYNWSLGYVAWEFAGVTASPGLQASAGTINNLSVGPITAVGGGVVMAVGVCDGGNMTAPGAPYNDAVNGYQSAAWQASSASPFSAVFGNPGGTSLFYGAGLAAYGVTGGAAEYATAGVTYAVGGP